MAARPTGIPSVRHLAVVLAPLLLAPLPAAAWTASAQLGAHATAASVSAEDFTVTLHMETRRIEDYEAAAPVFRIEARGAVLLEHVGEPSGMDDPQGTAILVEMDPSNRGPEVVFSSFTGGAHCCTALAVADRDAGGRWRVVDLGQWDGDGGAFDDLDGDGEDEFHERDNDFLYAFDCYACSLAPMTIRAVVGGEVRDVSAEPRFRDAHRGWLAELEADAPAAGEAGKGWWAGWVAAKARVGEGREAWKRFEREYRPGEDDAVDVCAVATSPCPDDQWVKQPFPEALRAFLTERGFRIE